MKLYIKTRNKFLGLSAFILVTALISIFIFKNKTFGNFLLGIFASTIIITIQYDLSAKVEESKLLIEKLKKISDLCFEFDEFNSFSVDYFALNFEDRFSFFKERLEYLFSLNNELENIRDLNKNTKKELKVINDKIDDLELSLHFILKNFEKQTNKMKIIYFIEFHQLIRDYNFEKLKDKVSELGQKIDSEEYYKSNSSEKRQTKIRNLEYQTSIQVYNKKIEEKNLVEYKALKNEFEKYMQK